MSLHRTSTRALASAFLLVAAACGDDSTSSTSAAGTGGGGGEGPTSSTGPSSSPSATSTGATTGTGGDPGSGGAGGEGTGGGTGGDAPAIELFDISVSETSFREHEPQVIVTPAGRVVVSWLAAQMDASDYYHINYRVSDDRGETWGPIEEMAQKPDNNISANATLAQDEDGTVYLAYGSELRTQTDRQNVRVHLARLAPNEDTFGEPMEVTDPKEPAGIYDQPAITINDAGDWVVTYGQGSPSLSAAWMAAQRSDDGGETWDKVIPSQAVPNHFQNLIHPCKAPGTDRLYLFYLDAEFGLTLWRSEDGGVTWPEDNRVAVQAPEEDATVSTGLDSNCIARGDEVWAVYGLTDDDPGGGQTLARLTDVRLAHSSDGGATFDSRTTVHDPEAGDSFLLPHLALADDGTIDLTYVAGDGPDDEAASIRLARSTDGGATFEPSVAVVDPVTYELDRVDDTWFGDYTGLTVDGGELFGVVVDNSTGFSHVVFFKTAP